MNGNTFGHRFRVTTYGESHGPALGAVIDGCPANLEVCPEDFSLDLFRRQGGNASFTTPRKETDQVILESGVFEGRTTGAPIALRIENKNIKSSDYEEFKDVPRPGHADLTTWHKHGHRDYRGGGRSSARETAARVAAGVIAKKVLGTIGVSISAWVQRVGPYEIPDHEIEACVELPENELRAKRDSNEIFCPGSNAKQLIEMIERIKQAGDSWGGAIGCRVTGLPVGLGEPIFDKLNAVLSHALMSLPAAVSCQIGGGDALSRLPGSAIRDSIGLDAKPQSNRHGGLLGGMTTGLPLHLSVSFHAPTSVQHPIESVNLLTRQPVTVSINGRHDSFPLPRAVPMVEAMAAIALADAYLRAR